MSHAQGIRKVWRSFWLKSFGDISKYFPYLPFWSLCMWTTSKHCIVSNTLSYCCSFRWTYNYGSSREEVLTNIVLALKPHLLDVIVLAINFHFSHSYSTITNVIHSFVCHQKPPHSLKSIITLTLPVTSPTSSPSPSPTLSPLSLPPSSSHLLISQF